MCHLKDSVRRPDSPSPDRGVLGDNCVCALRVKLASVNREELVDTVASVSSYVVDIGAAVLLLTT